MIFSLILLSSIGLFPGNTDIFMLALGSLSSSFLISETRMITICLIALFIGESLTYLVAHKYGKSILNFKFFKREKISKKVSRFQEAITKGSFLTALTIRMIPALRPINIAIAVSMSEKTRPLYRNHLLLLIVYVPLNILIASNFASFIKSML